MVQKPEPKCPICGNITEEAGEIRVRDENGFVDEIQPVLYCKNCDVIISIYEAQHETLLRPEPKPVGMK